MTSVSPEARRTASIGAPAVPAGSPSSLERCSDLSRPNTMAVQWCRASWNSRRISASTVSLPSASATGARSAMNRDFRTTDSVRTGAASARGSGSGIEGSDMRTSSRRAGGVGGRLVGHDRGSMTASAELSALAASGPTTEPDEVYDAFATWVSGRGLELYPAQSEALIELLTGANVILATPTGSGKSLVALGAHFAALSAGRRSVYTAPIKALVSEKFFDLCDVFGADNVGMATGDAMVNPTAPIICCTVEVLANQALREGGEADLGGVVMDEFHFYGDPERGWAWQVPLLELHQAQFLLMSATLGDMSDIRSDLSRRTGRDTALVTSAQRPVPLFHRYAVTSITETVTELLETHEEPVYIVHFTQAQALERAQALTSIPLRSREQRDEIAAAIGGFRFATGFGRTLSRLVRHGVGVHHAGMLPRYRRLVEQLAQDGLLAVICGTDTLGVGINVPIRTVVFTGLYKYDGNRTRHLRAREFHQNAGRAGRDGYDNAGTVVVPAQQHDE